AKAGLIETLFDRFDQHLGAQGYIARGGQIIDATIVAVPRQRNTHEENEAIKRGETPDDWEKKPAKNRQKDKDARWTKKHGKSFYGYKNHVNADAKHKLIRRYDVSDAAVHDSQKLDGLLHTGNTSDAVFGDSAYRSAETEATLKGAGLQEPHPCPRSAQSSTLEGERGGEPEEESGSRSHRARVRGSGDFIGWPDRSDDRHRQGTSEDRITEPRLQHPSPRDTRTDGRRMRVASVYAVPEWPAAAPSAAASTSDRP